MLTAKVGNNYLNFAFGATDPSEFVSVQSITRLMAEVPEGPLRNEMIRRVLRHEVGHMLGLPSSGRGNTEENLGPHCTNMCTMRQGLSAPEWAQHTIEEFNNGVHFCEGCQNDLAETRQRYRPLG
jgi:predicted Zn-dependent protease